jgi:hypothetical protein
MFRVACINYLVLPDDLGWIQFFLMPDNGNIQAMIDWPRYYVTQMIESPDVVVIRYGKTEPNIIIKSMMKFSPIWQVAAQNDIHSSPCG